MSAEDFKVKVGRRKKEVNMAKVAKYLRQGKTIGEIAILMKVSYKTLWTRIKEAKGKS